MYEFISHFTRPLVAVPVRLFISTFIHCKKVLVIFQSLDVCIKKEVENRSCSKLSCVNQYDFKCMCDKVYESICYFAITWLDFSSKFKFIF